MANNSRIPSEIATLFGNSFTALGFGLATTWLLAPLLRQRLRIVAFLASLAATLAGTALAYFAAPTRVRTIETLSFSILTGVCALFGVIALFLAGLMCRRKWRPAVLLAWIAVFEGMLWLLLTAPFILTGSGPSWNDFFALILPVAGCCYFVLFVFVLQATAVPSYRERLQMLLQIGTGYSPPVLNVLPVAEMHHHSQPAASGGK